MHVHGLRAEREVRRKARRRRSIVIALAGAATLIALTIGVFSVAIESREIAERSNRVHALDELLNSATIARAQLGFALVLDELDQFAGIDTSVAQASAAVDVRSRLVTLDTTTTQIDEQLGGLSPETTNAVGSFVDLAVQFSAAEPGQETIDARQLDLLFKEAADLVEGERNQAIADVQSADNRLGSLSTLVSFLTAFVIPTFAIGLFRLLSLPEREVLEAEARLTKNAVIDSLRQELLLGRLQAVQTRLEDDDEPAPPEIIARDLSDIRRLVLTLERSQRCHFEHVDLAEALIPVSTDSIEGALGLIPRVYVTTHDAGVWSDREVLLMLVEALIADCRMRGAELVRCEVATSSADSDLPIAEQHVELMITHDGALRSVSELTVLESQSTITDRLALLGGADTELAIARHLAEDLQGDLSIEENDDALQAIRLRLPASAAPTRPRRRGLIGIGGRR